MSVGTLDRWAPDKVARMAGGYYRAFILASVFAGALGHIGLGTAEQLYEAISADAWVFRLGLVSALTSTLLFLVAAWGMSFCERSARMWRCCSCC